MGPQGLLRHFWKGFNAMARRLTCQNKGHAIPCPTDSLVRAALVTHDWLYVQR